MNTTNSDKLDVESNAAQGNGANSYAAQPSALAGKRILFLGSSVTYGAASQGQSFVELFHSLVVPRNESSASAYH